MVMVMVCTGLAIKRVIMFFFLWCVPLKKKSLIFNRLIFFSRVMSYDSLRDELAPTLLFLSVILCYYCIDALFSFDFFSSLLPFKLIS